MCLGTTMYQHFSVYADYAIPKREQYSVIRLKLSGENFDWQVQLLVASKNTPTDESCINSEMGTSVCTILERWNMKVWQEFYAWKSFRLLEGHANHQCGKSSSCCLWKIFKSDLKFDECMGKSKSKERNLGKAQILGNLLVKLGNSCYGKEPFNIETIYNLSVNIQELLHTYKYKLSLKLSLLSSDSELFCDFVIGLCVTHMYMYESVNHDWSINNSI